MLFLGLPANHFSLFPVEFIVLLQRVSINRTQIPLILAFVITEYKVQRAMFKAGILNF